MPEYVTVDAFAALERRVAALEGVEPEPEPEPMTYVVQAGDTLSRIADELAVTVEDLAAWNGITDPNLIRVGQVLAVTAPAAEPTPLPEPPPDPEPQPEPQPDPGPAVMTDLTATTDGRFAVLGWAGATRIRLGADDYNAAGELVRRTDQGEVTGNGSLRGPMGDLSLVYHFFAQVVLPDGTVDETIYRFPPVSFAAAPTPAPGPSPAPSPTPDPTPGPVDGAVLWSDGPADPVGSTHPLANWEDAPWNIYAGSTVKVVSDPVKGKAIRAFAPAGGNRGDNTQRGEIVPDHTIRNGDLLWVGFDLLIPEADGLARAHQQVMQIKSAPSESYAVFSINVNNHREGLTVGVNGHHLGPTPYDQWTRIAIGFNISQGSDAWREIWRDGENILPREFVSNMRNGDKRCYLKFGPYRKGGLPNDLDIRFANVAIGRTRASVG